jgi:5-methylcytosine-specific restriction endonuclease McrA
MNENQLRKIWKKTKGHCHFCGDPIVSEKRGWKRGSLKGYWEVDHVIQLDKGGKNSIENCLPACTMCNRLRWSRLGIKLRKLIFLGLIAQAEIKKGTKLGKRIGELKKKRKVQTKHRRENR